MTMVALATTGHFQQCTTFNHSKSLVARVNDLSYASPHLVELWQDITAIEKTPKLRRAIHRAIQRFGNPPISIQIRSKFNRLYLRYQRLLS